MAGCLRFFPFARFFFLQKLSQPQYQLPNGLVTDYLMPVELFQCVSCGPVGRPDHRLNCSHYGQTGADPSPANPQCFVQQIHVSSRLSVEVIPPAILYIPEQRGNGAFPDAFSPFLPSTDPQRFYSYLTGTSVILARSVLARVMADLV